MAVSTKLNIKTLSYVIIFVKSTEKLLPFYRDVLGAKVKVSEPGWVEFDLGHVTLALHYQEEGHPKSGSAIVPVFPVEDIDGSYEYLKEKNIKIVQIPKKVCETPDGIGYSVDFEDPEGNVLSLFGFKK